MALSDCPKCWDTPCTCGWEYRNYKVDALVDLIWSMLNYQKKHKVEILTKVSQKMEEEQ